MKINAKTIKVMLAEKRMTQAQLARVSGVARQNLSLILKKGRCSPITAGKLAAGLGVAVEDILEEVQ